MDKFKVKDGGNRMTYTKINATAATLTKNRTEDSITPISGMCVTCVDGCIGMCEIGKSSYRGHEVIYPQPYGVMTCASEKNYPVDLSHFTIMGTAVGAHGIEADSDKAIFPNVDLKVALGHDKGIKFKIPIVIPGLGSTAVASNNWDGLAIGAALSGIGLTIGENVCGMDPDSTIEDGRIIESPDLRRRVKLFQDWQRDGYGEIIVQANVEDTRLGVQEYAIEKLGVRTVELKWGQGAKDIGGEVKLKTLERAQLLKSRGYVVLPDPFDENAIEAFKAGSFREFERHSRVGMVTEEGFMSRVQELRDAGAKYVFLKTGAYRPADLARAVKYCSQAKIDMLTVDAAGGGTGMSPWRMMNEWGIPTVQLECLTHQMCEKLAKKGAYIPPIAIAGGLSLEDHIFKGLALGAPYVKAICLGRALFAAAMVGKTHGKLMAEKMELEGESVVEGYLRLFAVGSELKERFGKDFEKLPAGAIGLYSYVDRMKQGLQQLMAGARKFALKHIDRNDLMALTRDAAEVSGIDYVMDADAKEVDKILG
jgi:glutamate synthase domain-containing protein 2